MFKVIVAGSRWFENYSMLEKVLDETLSDVEKLQIVSGTAKGADRLGERYALKRKIPIKRFPADWNTYGKSAGYRRNADMAKYGDMLIAFWDGESKGTEHMINLAKREGIRILVVRYSDNDYELEWISNARKK